MSKNTASVTVKYSNQIIEANAPTLGIAFVVAKTPRGPVEEPINLISSPGQLALYFGDDDGTLYPQMPYLKTLLSEGGKIRVSRILGATAEAAKADVSKGSDPYFKVSAKHLGVYGNAISVTVSAASDGIADHFDLSIEDSGTGQSESFVNIDPSDDVGTVGPYSYLDKVINNSSIINVAYADISTLSTIPDIGTTALTSGSDGAAIIADDFARGCTAFDNYDDAFLITFPGMDDDSTEAPDSKGMAYANAREDLVFVGNIPESKATQADIVTFLQTKGSSRYVVFVGGGLTIKEEGLVVNTLTHAAVVGHMCKAQGEHGVWNSPAGTQAGTLQSAIGVVNNFAPVAKFNELNAIANAGGDMVIQKHGLIYLKDGYTMSQDSVDKFISVVMTDIYLRKLIVPIFEDALNKANIPRTWSETYYTCKPQLDQMVQDGAILGYEYKGDQFANGPDDYEVNLPADVAQGKYKAKLSITTVSPMVEVEITIIKTLEGVTTT